MKRTLIAVCVAACAAVAAVAGSNADVDPVWFYSVAEGRATVTGVKSVSVSGLPQGLAFDRETLSIVGAPTKVGVSKMTVTTVGGTTRAFEVTMTVAAMPGTVVGTAKFAD